jgi:hypothetical protein
MCVCVLFCIAGALRIVHLDLFFRGCMYLIFLDAVLHVCSCIYVYVYCVYVCVYVCVCRQKHTHARVISVHTISRPCTTSNTSSSHKLRYQAYFDQYLSKTISCLSETYHTWSEITHNIKTYLVHKGITMMHTDQTVLKEASSLHTQNYHT